MEHVDEASLESDLIARYRFVAEFIGFGEEDVKAIHASAGYLAPLIPQIVEQTYDKLLSYDATARHFVPRQKGYDGPLPTSLDDLASSHPQIQFRKDHLNRYLMHLVGHAYNDKMALFLDMAGKIHTPKAGNEEIDVSLVQMNALLGLLADLVFEAILGLSLDEETKARTMRAFNKLFWIQNDLVTRHYQQP
jgi:hypothetical protein